MTESREKSRNKFLQLMKDLREKPETKGIKGEAAKRIFDALTEAARLLKVDSKADLRDHLERVVGSEMLLRRQLRNEGASLDQLTDAVVALEAVVERTAENRCADLILPRDRGWEFVPTHVSLVDSLKTIAPEDLRCMRMMGTMIGAAGRAEAEVKYDKADLKDKQDDGREVPLGMIEETAQLIYRRWDRIQSLLLIGSSNNAVPMDQAPYHYYTYLFVSRVVSRLIHLLQKDEQRMTRRPKNQQLQIQFTFVPEDILFAQFFYDKSHLVVAATYSWSTLDELQERAYAAVYLDNVEPPKGGGDGGADPTKQNQPEPRFPDTARRLVEIFDARFREQVALIGQEAWTVKRLNERDWGVLVETAFWRQSKSVLRAFEFQFDPTARGEEALRMELGPNMLARFRSQVEDLIGLTPVVTSTPAAGTGAVTDPAVASPATEPPGSDG